MPTFFSCPAAVEVPAVFCFVQALFTTVVVRVAVMVTSTAVYVVMSLLFLMPIKDKTMTDDRKLADGLRACANKLATNQERASLLELSMIRIPCLYRI